MSFINASVPATIRPARAMTSISRGDLRVIILLAKGPAHAAGDLCDRSDGGNTAHRLARVVPREEGRGLLAIGPQPRCHCRRVVVGAVLEAPAPVQPRQNLVVGHI